MDVKFISLNLWWGGNLFPEIIAFLKAHDADIIALQEVYNGADSSLEDRYRSIATLQKQLDYPYVVFDQSYVHDSPMGMIPQGNAILSKFPITRSSARFLTKPTQESYEDIPELWPIFPRLLQNAALETPAGAVNIFNIHGVWDLDGDNYSEARKQMSLDIIEEISNKPNVILAGDSNAKFTNPAIRNLEEHLYSVFPVDTKTTFNMRRKDNPGYATAAVDILFVDKAIEVISAEIPDVDISDHLPLVATLRIP